MTSTTRTTAAILIVVAIIGGILGLATAPTQAAGAQPAIGRWATPRVVIHMPAKIQGWKIDRAVRAWRATGLVTIVVSATPCNGCVEVVEVERYDVPGVGTIWGGVAFPSLYADGTLGGCRIELASDIPKADRAGITAHELGHCLGLGHTDDKAPSVMGNFIVNRRPTALDAANLAALYAPTV